jgi:hypothetical protein
MSANLQPFILQESTHDHNIMNMNEIIIIFSNFKIRKLFLTEHFTRAVYIQSYKLDDEGER